MTSNRAAIIFLHFTAAYVWLVCCALDYGEQPRMMWLVYSFLLIIAVVDIRWLYRRIKKGVTQ